MNWRDVLVCGMNVKLDVSRGLYRTFREGKWGNEGTVYCVLGWQNFKRMVGESRSFMYFSFAPRGLLKKARYDAIVKDSGESADFINESLRALQHEIEA